MDFARTFSAALASDLALASDPAVLAEGAVDARPQAAAPAHPPAPPTPSPARSRRQFFAYVLGVTLCMVAAFELGAHPSTFYRLYTLLAFALFGLRYVMYKERGWHLYMLDWCYWGNALYLYHLWFEPRSLALRRACFALATGPLSMSVPTFRNSLVFHSLDKLTSLFIHLGPALVAWSVRWHPGPLPGTAPTAAISAAERACAAAARTGAASWWPAAAACRRAPRLPADWDDATMGQLVGGALVPWYLSWAVVYTVFIFVVARERIQRRGLMTLYKYYTDRPGPIARAVAAVPRGCGPLVYMACHLLATTTSLALSWVWWHSYAAHSLFVVALIGACAYNGATYYLDYLLRAGKR